MKMRTRAALALALVSAPAMADTYARVENRTDHDITVNGSIVHPNDFKRATLNTSIHNIASSGSHRTFLVKDTHERCKRGGQSGWLIQGEGQNTDAKVCVVPNKPIALFIVFCIGVGVDQ